MKRLHLDWESFQKETHKMLLIFSAIMLVAIVLTLIIFIRNYKRTKIESLTKDSTSRTTYRVIKTQETGKSQNGFRVILFGDSRIKDWGNPSLGMGITIINLGVAGETTYQNMCRLDKILALKPDLLILQIGINDIVAINLLPEDLRMKVQTESIQNLRKIMAKLSDSKIQTMLFTIIPPISPSLVKKIIWGNNLEETTKAFNHAICTKTPANILIFNMRDFFFDAKNNTWRRQWSKDALHWTDEAYQALTLAIKNQLVAQSILVR